MKKNLTIQPDGLAGLTVFRTVAQAGSFTRAADRLGVSASAVSQSVRGLEARLGVRLFNRTSRRVALSEAGRDLLAQIDPSLDRIDIALQRLRAGRDQPSGLLRINLSRLVAGLYVVPRLPEFLARHPRLQVELFTDDTLADVVAGGFDAGIRLGHHLARDMVARPIDGGRQRRAIVATPDYLRRHGTPRTPADLVGFDCLRFRMPGSGRLEPWHFVDAGRELQVEVQGRLIYTDDRMVREAARDGLGMAQLFEKTVEADIATGRLVQVLADYAPSHPGFYIYYPAREHMPPKLRAFVDFLCEPARTHA
ncbi:LysR family transcriptional regulator [Luteimonas aquatica]|uniref:LysR family transcriptional regulator n=1 Tax=Luteimonas aquatica TaxID=450364 RepID=UPI001F566DDE|nr:LysR family transcriptional regulator [Luteimonas aquatica]